MITCKEKDTLTKEEIANILKAVEKKVDLKAANLHSVTININLGRGAIVVRYLV